MKTKFKVKSLKLKVNSGFSMVEMLVVIALMGIISVIVTQILVISIRSSIKAEVSKEVKQNGDYAMSTLQKAIRNASDVTAGCNAASNQIVLLNPDSSTTTFTCNNATRRIVSGLGDLTNNKVRVNNAGCRIFRVVCPTPPVISKYVYINFTLTQVGSGSDPNSSASLPYQSTIELRSSQQ